MSYLKGEDVILENYVIFMELFSVTTATTL